MAEPNYPAAYFATDLDRGIAGIRTAYVPAGAPFLTSTGSPFDPQICGPFFAPVTHQSYFHGSATFACNHS